MANSLSTTAPGGSAGGADASVRPAQARDLPAMCELSVEQGWPHRIDDWRLMLGLAEAVVLEDGSGVIGCGLRLVQGESASLALILIKRACRGRGLGKRVMAALVEQSPTSSLFLNATQEGAPLYRKYGFTDVGSVVQWQGTCSAGHLDRSPLELEPIDCADSFEIRQLLHQARGVEPDLLIAAIDRSREQLIGLREAGALTGFACLRPFGRGWVIGPVVAGSAAEAILLIEGLAADLDGQFLRVDLSGSLPDAVQLEVVLQRLGLAQADRVNLMWRGEVPTLVGEQQLYALFSQATG